MASPVGPLQAFLQCRVCPNPGLLEKEFQEIKERAWAFRQQAGYSTDAGAARDNIKKNRYKDILPYDQTRVVLTLVTEEGQGDYINANFIKGAGTQRCYIATQGPLPHTLLDFWRMVWQYRVKVIIMACREVEMGRKKCERYWPLENEPLQLGPFCITQTQEQQLNPDIMTRFLCITFQKESRRVTHAQYLAWPDRGIPDSCGPLLALVERMRSEQGADPSPLCVHCSAGCGRTGVICAAELVRDLLVQRRIPPNFSLFDLVLEIRKQRPAAVQTLEQYEFLHRTVAEMFQGALADDPTGYENLKENQLPLYDDAVAIRHPPAPPRIHVLRSISVPAEPSPPEQPPKMNDTYAVVNKATPALVAVPPQHVEPYHRMASTPWASTHLLHGGAQAQPSLPPLRTTRI
ncbi:tyrosine-protein phosphatase non-receptor type 18 isoform X6 [Alligator mississippiensis]|uniref:tyrosine-protein phosphatase non-receptor type 18 isoform X6 n=1 Tax=Alligator mississippiensis TaxID=8496 RepID=UPI0009072CC5|nr:tyrosine-protein phosphatase non-receptor type 18 isoform X6 [Alligator mississippiensis]